MNDSLFNAAGPNCDPLWEKLRNGDNPRYSAVKRELELMWENYQPYADPNFRQEFANHVHQRFWEIYLACHLLDHKRKLMPRAKQSSKGPDILIEEGMRRIWIEAVAPTPGNFKNPDKVTDIRFDGTVNSVPNKELLLRVTGQLFEKAKKYRQYLEDGAVKQGDLCLIAISGGDMSGFQLLEGDGYIENAFYPTRFKVSGQEEWTWRPPHRIQRTSGELIQTSVFTSPEFEHITGAIFSPDSIARLLKKESNFQYFPNPNCSQSLPQKWIPWSKEIVVTEDHSNLLMETIDAVGSTISTVAGPFPKTHAQ